MLDLYYSMSAPVKKLKLVCVYAAPDAAFCLDLEKHLTSLVKEERIEVWHPGMLLPGEDHDSTTAKQFDQADIIVPLLSVDFIHTPQTFALLGTAVERFLAGKSRVLPVVVRAADYSCIRLDKAGIQVLTREGTPICQWSNLDAAWAEVAREIRKSGSTRHSQVQKKGLRAPLKHPKAVSEHPHQAHGQPANQPSNRMLLGIALFAVCGLLISLVADQVAQGPLVEYAICFANDSRNL